MISYRVSETANKEMKVEMKNTSFYKVYLIIKILQVSQLMKVEIN